MCCGRGRSRSRRGRSRLIKRKVEIPNQQPVSMVELPEEPTIIPVKMENDGENKKDEEHR